MTVLWAGLVVWFATLVIVEGEIFREVREWADRIHPKIGYLAHCHMCCGTWVGFVVGLLVPGPLPLRILNGLLYKAVGHLILAVQHLLERIANPPPNFVLPPPQKGIVE